MIVNLWLVLSEQAQTRALESVRWDEESQGEYNGPLTNRQRRLFNYFADGDVVRQRFSSPTLQGRVANLWSLTFDEARDTLQAIQSEIDTLLATYPNNIAVIGAWNFRTGEQVGGYTIPNWAWRMMPADIGATSNADLQDINLIFGQAPRDFS